MKNPSQDPGCVRWFIFIPGQGRFAVPPEVVDKEAYALASGATRLFVGNDVRWSRPVTSGHLAVVR